MFPIVAEEAVANGRNLRMPSEKGNPGPAAAALAG